MITHTHLKDPLKMLIGYEYTKEHSHKAFSSARIQAIMQHSFHQIRHQKSVENGLPCQHSAYPFHTVSTTHHWNSNIKRRRIDQGGIGTSRWEQFDNPMIPRRKEETNSALQARNEAKQELAKTVPIFVNPFIHSESGTFLLSMHHQ